MNDLRPTKKPPALSRGTSLRASRRPVAITSGRGARRDVHPVAPPLPSGHARVVDEVTAVVHELRNYLMPLRFSTELLARRTGGDAEVGRTVGMVRQQVAAMQRLVGDLLDVSRAGRGRLDVRCEPVVLQDVVESALAIGRPAAEAKSQRVEWEGAGEPLRVMADPMRLQQALSNVVLNAIRYSPPGTAIRVRSDRRGADVQVVVRDDGEGMDAVTQSRLFELYATGNGACREGLGVGLYLVRQIMHRLGGEVSAHSDGPGCGSTFTITLPGSGGA